LSFLAYIIKREGEAEMNWGQWVYGLITAVVTAFASAASGAVGLPTVFTFDKPGLINMLKLSAAPAFLAFFAYLKQNPAPMIKATVDPAGNVKVVGNPVVTVEVEGKPKP
jgi:hypothetical protein